jgi:L-serine dehydratase
MRGTTTNAGDRKDQAQTSSVDTLDLNVIPPGVDRRTLLMRSAVISAAALLSGRSVSAAERTAAATAPPPTAGSKLSPDLDVVEKVKGPVITVLDEFYKVGPGPSSLHTIGPMRITYDAYQRCTKLPKETRAVTWPGGARERR